MREKILTILSVLSQNVLREKDLFYDAQEICEELAQQGFSEEDIEKAIVHIEQTTLGMPGPYWSDEVPLHRAFSGEEQQRITAPARGYLWKLKYRGVIDHALEDEIIHKVMNLDENAGLREIKTVAALTVFGYEHRLTNASGEKTATVNNLRIN